VPISTAARDRLAFALDYPTLEQARRGAALVGRAAGVLKVGLELYVREGPAAVAMCRERDAAVFLDLKLHDIPETVSGAVGAACGLGVKYLTLHAAGGRRMLEAARERAERENTGITLLAVTVLTSLDTADLAEVGVDDPAATQVERLADLALQSGAHGLVCSALEVGGLRSRLSQQAVLVTPGIRPCGNSAGDQKRVAAPGAAIRAGADLLVVGRPIRDSADPYRAACAILEEIEAAKRDEPQRL
jgi:orotidine-5'-phosphate decarboxylase